MIKTTGLTNIKITDIKTVLRMYSLDGDEVEVVGGLLFRKLQNMTGERIEQSASDYVHAQMKLLGYKQPVKPGIFASPSFNEKDFLSLIEDDRSRICSRSK